MRRAWLAGLIFLAACGGAADVTMPDSTIAKAPRPDPYITVRIRNLLDTTSAAGRADWHIYDLLTGPYTAQNGIAFQGEISLNDYRLGHTVFCTEAGADSVGQRLFTVLAIADTTSSELTPDATSQAIVDAWYAGNVTLPTGWAALAFPPTDAWLSAQYLAGHGLTPDDPIRWGLDWTGAGVVTFYERTDSDPLCGKFG